MKNMKNEKCLAESRNQNLTVKRYMAHFINISLFYGHKSDRSFCNFTTYTIQKGKLLKQNC